jgi:ATP-dependent phosphofructokinase / diphosphate-dependent phosphofructokinase
LRFMVGRHKRTIVVMTEGYQIEDFDKRHDHSGQVMYGSSRNTNAQLLVNELNDRNLTARAFVPGFDQRSDMRFTSTIDLEAAFGVSKCCMKWLARGDGQFFATICRSEDALNGIGFKQVALAEIHDYGRSMPAEWVSNGTYDVTDAYVDYVLPLIGMGQVPVPNAEFDSYFQGPLRAI